MKTDNLNDGTVLNNYVAATRSKKTCIVII